MLSGIYLGFVLGILRYRLFDLERWWFAAWLWLIGGALVVLADIALMTLLNVGPLNGLALSIFFMGWIYFPARQWLWSKFVRSPSQSLEAHLPILLKTFISLPGTEGVREQWGMLLTRIFDPLDQRVISQSRNDVTLEQDGLVLAVPAITSGDGHLQLSGRGRGSSLFTRNDVRLASFILTLARKSIGLHAAHERGATLERERIARDLHDDVAPQLLTLIHRAENDENARAAHGALQTLRESINALNNPADTLLDEAVAEWRRESVERTEAAGVALKWHQSEIPQGSVLSSRHCVNLTRVLREAITNALKHSAPSLIQVDIEVKNDHLNVRVSNDGRIAELPTSGNGMRNMRTYIEELDGEIDWQREEDDGTGKPLLRVRWSVRNKHRKRGRPWNDARK